MFLRYALAFSVAVSTALGSAALGEEAAERAETPQPARLIGARCVFCHGPTLMLAFSRRMVESGGMEALDAFLASHHAPDAEARAAIVRFLADPLGTADAGN